MAYLRDRRAFGNIGTRKFRGARFGDPLSPRFSGLLDQYPGAAAAYSLRRLGSYGGDVVEVRRSSDSATDTFTASQITNGDLVTFCGVGDGFVSTWYDQSGNANNATQATTTAQPKIVDAGSLVTGGLDFDGVDDYLKATFGTSTSESNYALISVATLPDSTINQTIIGTGLTDGTFGGEDAWFFKRRSGLANELSLNSGTTSIATSPAGVPSIESLFESYSDSVNTKLYSNGAELVSATSVNIDGQNLIIGNRSDIGAVRANGMFAEIIVYYSDQSANRTGIETNINAAYTIY